MGVAAVKRFRAWFLLATFVATLGLTGFSADHLGLIDIACGAVGLVPGDRVTQLGAASVGDAQHCPVCHFLRAVSGARTTAVARLALQDGLTVQVATTTRIPPVVDKITRPSRGPPATTLTFVI